MLPEPRIFLGADRVLLLRQTRTPAIFTNTISQHVTPQPGKRLTKLDETRSRTAW